MIFLPIVERELRVAARKRSTFWVRIIAAIVGMLIGCGFLILAEAGILPFGMATLGRGLFGVLTWLSLAAVLSAGLFLTSDCLSEEKREGTLGLLFLTDLGGYDVVSGKLLATSLRGFYALLAVLPVLAITLIMGGVTGEQFGKASLALVNALFLSLAAGMFVSAISRDSQKALAGTLLLLVLLAAAGPAIDALCNTWLSWSSPFHLFMEAGRPGGSAYWLSLLANQLEGWFLFGMACLVIPRNWQDKPGRRAASSDWAQRWKFGSVKGRMNLRRTLLGLNPVLWLVCRERWQGGLLWAATILMVSVLLGLILHGDDSSPLWMVWNYYGGVFNLLLYLGIASQACRFFVDARRSGLIELFLVTPLTVAQIVQGQFHALWRMFGLPLMLCLAVQFYGNFVAERQQMKIIMSAAAATAAIPPAPPLAPTLATNLSTLSITNTNKKNAVSTGGWTSYSPAGSTGAGASGATVVGGGFTAPNTAVILGATLAGTLTLAVNLAALVWFGMWMGLNSKSGNVATMKTILFVQIIPWFVIGFVSLMVVPFLIMPNLMQGGTGPPTNFMFWFPLVITGVANGLALVKDLVFVICARRLLHSKFRERAAPMATPIRLAPPPRIVLSQIPK